jgi:dihydropteroate synthase
MAKDSAPKPAGQGTRSVLTSVLDKPWAIMGIVNVTPDSFYDGGLHYSVSLAIEHACHLADQGAAIIDIGGQSTRPGALPVDCKEESGRIVPVIQGVAKRVRVPISVDTYYAETAAAALDAGASMVNDISAGRLDAAMPEMAAKRRCPVILMHSRDTPLTMQESPVYEDVIADVKKELLVRVGVFLAAGVDAGNILIDPGIGFAKRLEDNLSLLTHLGPFVATGYPVCLGVSRKSFIGRLSAADPGARLPGSLASIVPAFHAGVKLFRVHDVEETVQFLRVLQALHE